MSGLAVFREEMKWAHGLLAQVTADVTTEMAHWTPPGLVNPLAAVWAHAVLAEDGVVNVLLRGEKPMFETSWAGRTGLSASQWGMDLEWARSLRIDVPVFRDYQQAVIAATDALLDSVDEPWLDQVRDLSQVGFGAQPNRFVMAALLVSHLNNMIGEISCLKGLQGARGYPH